ncbi:MAG TPA: hypothetical protein VMZ11_09845, partial [Mycobacteriales bacterium]|nr:hypothetical protein [Mycobacteriales bacterium]
MNPLDPAQDPDRYDAAADAAPSGPLDPEADPDKYRSPTLPGLLGEGAQEDERNNLTWLLGLVSVFAFLVVISLLVRLGNG